MTPDELRQIGEAMHGYGWQTALARLLKIESRAIRFYLSGGRRIPEPTAILLRILAEHPRIKARLEKGGYPPKAG